MAVSWRVQVRGGGGRSAFAPQARRAGALVQRKGLARCARRPRAAPAPAPRLQPHRCDCIASERPKRGSASFALQASRVVPHGCIKRTARVLNVYEGCCDAVAHGVICVFCSCEQRLPNNTSVSTKSSTQNPRPICRSTCPTTPVAVKSTGKHPARYRETLAQLESERLGSIAATPGTQSAPAFDSASLYYQPIAAASRRRVACAQR